MLKMLLLNNSSRETMLRTRTAFKKMNKSTHYSEMTQPRHGKDVHPRALTIMIREHEVRGVGRLDFVKER